MNENPFNILTDLLPGDKIRRTCNNGCGIAKGTVLTFKAYVTEYLMLFAETEEMKANEAGWIRSFEFVERPVKPFNMFTDLKLGDKIRRIEKDFNDVKEGDVVTFYNYCSEVCLSIIEKEYTMYIDKFVLAKQLNKKQEKEMKNQLEYYLTAMNDNEYLFEITTQPFINFTFRDSTGFKIESISRPDTSIENDTLYVKGTESFSNMCIISHKNVSVLNTYLDRMKNAIKEYNESITEKNLHKEEYIKAMKTTIKEYVDGTHKFNASTCALCKITKKYNDINSCTICPWVVITGNTCKIIPDFLVNERITELLDWIEKYKAM